MAKAGSSIEDLLSSAGKTKLTGNATATSSTATDDDKKGPQKTKLKDLNTQERLANKLKKITDIETEGKVAQYAASVGTPYIDLHEFPIAAEALQAIPMNICEKERTICFVFTGEEIRIGAVDPTGPEIEKIKRQLEESQHASCRIYVISEKSLAHALAMYAKVPRYVKPAYGIEVTEAELEKFKGIGKDFRRLNEEIAKVTITELTTFIVAAALEASASDIHVEAEEKDIVVRFRVDGVLHETATIDREKWNKVISRLKLISGLKMNITDKPQDGRFSIKMTKDKIDVRVSCLPTAWGESVVMRLLKASTAGLQFEQLGLVGKSYETLKFQVERPNGMIITTGPTGSGKTTTLYAILNKLNNEETKIITLEDPVEYKLEGINQSQIDHSKGYNFADGLRSILRQDPDIVMVGELRDLETADVAINAALTGHLVISTIHTNSAAGAIPRFLAMEVKPFLLAPALNAVIGQRLVRKLCAKCKKETILSAEIMERVQAALNSVPNNHPDRPDLSKLTFMSAAGCAECNGLGYKGRIGIYEIMVMTPEIEQMILSGAVSEYQIQEIAIKNGMLTMVQDGLIKALQGTTSVDEVFSVAE